jgi:integrative and conjugative element protein (TIGR02256 family)
MSSAVTSVWIANAAIDNLVIEATEKSPSETGGVLLGYQVDNGTATVVTAIVGPGPMAQHSRTAYVPDHDYQEKEIARIYAASERCTTYVGDWHSHPGGSLYLSRTDVRTLRTIARHKNARLSSPVMIVAAFGTPEWNVAVWQWRPSWLKFKSGPALALLLRF